MIPTPLTHRPAWRQLPDRIGWAVPFVFAVQAMALETPTYNRDIRPILTDKCFQCHGPDAAKREGDLRLDVRDDALRAGAIVPGKASASAIIERIHHRDPDEVMPPPASPRQLSAADKETLARWIDAGAVYEEHWAFVPPPAEVKVPAVKHPDWPRGDIDRFIAARLDQESLRPSPAATPERWLRRAAFDLTGLPPDRTTLDAFLADPSPEAKEKAIDRLLAADAYGEHMAAGWLDVARYADSFGYQSDIDTHAWPYRDWVISALNRNLPWDQFITWQLAGDLLPGATREQIIATAFNRIHRKTQEGGSVEEEFRQEGVSDRVHTFGTAFLGLTLECSRCHDHKYDPLPTREYYALGAFFNSIDEWGLLHGLAHIQPNPALHLTTPAQDAEIEKRKTAVDAAEDALAATLRQREAAFQAWLAAPTATDADLSGSYDLDARDGDSLANTANPSNPGKSGPRNPLVPGHRGQALSFTGDDPLALGNHGVSHQEDAFSVSFRLKPGPPAKRQVVFHNSSGYDPGYNGFELLFEDGRLRWMAAREWPGNCIAVRTRDTLPPDRWIHVSVSYDGSSRAAGLKLHLDGAEAPVEVVRDHLTRNCGSASAFTFGERVRDSGLRGGAVDEIRIHGRPLTALEVHALHHGRALPDAIAAIPRDEAGLARLREYYFAAIDPEARTATATLKAARRSLREVIDGVRELPVMREMPEPRPAYVLARGDYHHPTGDPVPRATPAVLPPFPKDEAPDRLGLARWLTDPGHPLTARVQVNRVWQHFFGRGLVATPENFGSQGERPSHPELLDWLARDFIRHGWDMKRLCRMIVLSATYGQDSKTDATLRDRDPSNILLARGPAKRLTGEQIRDQALALSGLLNPRIGGPPVKPYLPEAATWRALNSFLPAYQRDKAPDIHRRSLYTFWRRTAPPPGMLAFDVPSRDVCSVHRQQTDTPLQPLVTLNDPQHVEAQRSLAIRMTREGGASPASRATWLMRESLGRDGTPEEIQLLTELHRDQLDRFNTRPDEATNFLKVGDLVAPGDIPPAELAASAVVVAAVLNLDEAITLR